MDVSGALVRVFPDRIRQPVVVPIVLMPQRQAVRVALLGGQGVNDIIGGATVEELLSDKCCEDDGSDRPAHRTSQNACKSLYPGPRMGSRGIDPREAERPQSDRQIRDVGAVQRL
jgi:hypothetical protein